MRNINTVCQCNTMAGGKTLHPLVSVIDLSQMGRDDLDNMQVDFYCIVLKEYSCKHYAFGHKECDYSDGTIVFLSPGETLNMQRNHEVETAGGWMLAFHPTLVRGTFLGIHLDEYSFMNYSNDEALHISMREKKVFMRCLENISEELHRPIDRYSRELVTRSIDLLLGYCTRFYSRQFITRSEENKLLIKKTERIVYDYYLHPKTKTRGLPSAKYCAGLLHLSPAYFTELLRQETGHTVNEYMQCRRIEIAKRWLAENDKPVAEIASLLGFSSTKYFIRLLERLTGGQVGEVWS